MANSQKPELKTIEPCDVSFIEILPGDNWEEMIQRVATAIDVPFTDSSRLLPFVPFKEFRNLLHEEKVFLIGPSGSGKSRTIIELLRKKEDTNQSGKGKDRGRIFVINPSNPTGLDSGRENISVLSQRFSRNDLVIWDNFPDGLVKRDLESAFGALEIINSRPVQNLYIALKPTYSEIYRGLTVGIPDFYTCEITCDLETMKSLVRAYGNNVEQFRDVFEEYVAANADRIARALWQKQPLSLTVVDYYKALISRIEGRKEKKGGEFDSSNALYMAQTWLPAYDYFERQFEVLRSIESRRDDVDFLYVLRFCYEAGFGRTPDLLVKLQRSIFESSPPFDPTRKLGTWVYLSGQNYAMHDSAKNAVRLTDYVRMKVISYLTNHFLEMVPKGDAELHSLGLFLGKNVQLIASNDSSSGDTAASNRRRIVPDCIYALMKKKGSFERAFGRGVGEEFEKLDDSLQESILDYVDTEIEFGVGLADSLGERFVELDDYNRKRVFEKIYQGMLFARYFGQSVGRLYGRLSDELRSLVMTHAEKNPQFADGLGMGLGYVYAVLEPEQQEEIMSNARQSFEISRGLGFGFGLTFTLVPTERAREVVVAIADRNSELDTGFGMGLAASYSNLPDKVRRFMLDRASKDCEFGFGAGIYSAFSYREACPREMFELLHTNTEVAGGLGLGFGTSYFYLPEQFQSQLDSLATNNLRLDDGIGTGIGLVLKHLPSQIQEKFFAKALVNNAFATGFGYGLGFTWHYLGEELRQKVISIANTNNEFAGGVGIGLGSHIDYLKPTFFDQVMGLAGTNSEFDRGIGEGAAWAWPYFSDDSRRVVDERMKTSSEFARGIGFGLARIVRHFSDGEKEKVLSKVSQDPSFAEGFGQGIACFLWSVSNREEKEQFLEQASENPEVAKGLGNGLGLLYSFFKSELFGDGGSSSDGSVITCNQLFQTNSNFRRGIGTGMGRAYRYLADDARSEAFRMAEEDLEFAVGLGEGIGSIYAYLEVPQEELVMSYAEESTGLSRGLGKGLGLVFSYLSDDMKNKILGYAAHNEQLSRGLGTGIAMRISYLSEAVASRIFQVARNNRLLATGLGEGCGLLFSNLTQVTKVWLSSRASNIDGFAFGLGVGIGKMKRVWNDSSSLVGNPQERQAAELAKGSEFSEGLAIGLGTVIADIPRDKLPKFLHRARESRDFARNFAFAFGHTFSTFENEKRNDILNLIKDNEDLHFGLGEALGHSLPGIGSRLVEDVMQTTDSIAFSRGAAKGISESFTHLNLAEILGVLQYAGSHQEYGEVLGEGLAERFASFDGSKQSMILDVVRQDNNFSRAFARTFSKILLYVSPAVQERMNELIEQFPHLSSANQKR